VSLCGGETAGVKLRADEVFLQGLYSSPLFSPSRNKKDLFTKDRRMLLFQLVLTDTPAKKTIFESENDVPVPQIGVFLWILRVEFQVVPDSTRNN